MEILKQIWLDYLFIAKFVLGFIAILAVAVVLVDKTVAQRNCACSEVTNEAFVRSHTSCGHWWLEFVYFKYKMYH